nr:Chain WA, CaRSPs2 [Porphyridium purpureum]7Y4L_cA Chain cA, CaRSPs2 [Porphyridium purpureum]
MWEQQRPRRCEAPAAPSSRPAERRAAARRSRAQLRMKQDDYEQWKTEFAGGFPGGEAFYKKWIEEGAKGDVPALEEELQPRSPNKKPTIYEEQMISNRGQQKGVDPTWKTLLAGGFPGGEFFFKKWIGEGAQGEVPNLDADLQPGSGSAKKTGKKEDADKSSPGGIMTPGRIMVPSGLGEEEETVDKEAPRPELYNKYFSADRLHKAPEILFEYNKTKYDRVGVRYTEVTSKASERFFPKSRMNRAPVIEISYREGAVSTASVSLSMPEISGPPALPFPVPKGDVTTTMVTDPTTGRLKLEFKVDGAAVSAYSDPRA